LNNLSKTIQPYIELIRINKPIGIFLLLWPTYWALWIASSGHPDIKLVIIFTIGTVLMRSAGCAINDFADREIDPQVDRTCSRPLPKKTLKPYQAVLAAALLSFIAFLLVLQTNQETILMSFVALLLASIYPFTKRFTMIPQVFLGAAFAWSIPMAFAAHSAPLNSLTWMLFAITVFWTIAYDTIYAMIDRKDDIQIGIGSTAILFGRNDRQIIAILQSIVALGLLFIGQQSDLGNIYYLGVTFAIATFIYQQWLIRARRPKDCFRAFLNNAWTGGAIFLGFALGY